MEELEVMEKQEKQWIIDSIKENRLYDYICSNHWRIENNVLLDLLLECIATLKEEQNTDLIDNLIDYKEWEVK